jgi:hypothetical protein
VLTEDAKERRIDGTGSSVASVIVDFRLPGRSISRGSRCCETCALHSREAGVGFANLLEAALVRQQRLLVFGIGLRRGENHRAEFARAERSAGDLVLVVHVGSHVVVRGREEVALSTAEEDAAAVLLAIAESVDSLRRVEAGLHSLSVGHLDSGSSRLLLIGAEVELVVELVVGHLDILHVPSADFLPRIFCLRKAHQLCELLISHRRQSLSRGRNVRLLLLLLLLLRLDEPKTTSHRRLSRLRERNERLLLLLLGRRSSSIGTLTRRNSRRLLSNTVDLRLVSVQPILASESSVEALVTLVWLLVGVLLADVLLHVVRTSEESRTSGPGARESVGELATGESGCWGCCRCCWGGVRVVELRRRRCLRCGVVVVVVVGGACALLELLVRHVSEPY